MSAMNDVETGKPGGPGPGSARLIEFFDTLRPNDLNAADMLRILSRSGDRHFDDDFADGHRLIGGNTGPMHIVGRKDQ